MLTLEIIDGLDLSFDLWYLSCLRLRLAIKHSKAQHKSQRSSCSFQFAAAVDVSWWLLDLIVSVANKQHGIIGKNSSFSRNRLFVELCVCSAAHQATSAWGHVIRDNYLSSQDRWDIGSNPPVDSWSTVGFIPSWANLEDLQGLWSRCLSHHSRPSLTKKWLTHKSPLHFCGVTSSSVKRIPKGTKAVAVATNTISRRAAA